MWHLNSDHIKVAIDPFDWVAQLDDLDSNEQFFVFNTAIMNITNFVPTET